MSDTMNIQDMRFLISLKNDRPDEYRKFLDDIKSVSKDLMRIGKDLMRIGKDMMEEM